MFIKKLISCFIFHLILRISLVHCNGYISYGPDIKGSVGEIWPKPLWQSDTGRYYGIDPNNFELVAVNKNCMLMQKALERYSTIIRNSAQGYIRAPQTIVVHYIQQIRVNLTKKCETLPHLNMDESYFVWGDGRVIANSVWGILRGLETLSQLLVPMPNDILRIPETEIYDAPRFKYRGLMLDSARHYISKSKIFQLLEGMAYNKLNVFHWHLTDDSAFPFNSTIFPELSIKGAYRPEMTYSENDVREIVEFARKRGIRVVPEFDTPAHTASWGASHPEIMTECFGDYAGQLGPLNPTKDTTFEFLYELFSELRPLFPDEYLHLGVDEVDWACWESNPQIQSFLVSKGLENVDLPYMYLERFTANMSTLGWKQMIWQEGMTENFWMEWPAGTIGQVWFDYKTNAPHLTSHNYDIVRSQDWYMYVLDSGGDWQKFYLIEPTDFEGTKKQKDHVLGGEACLWSEFINEHNVLPTTFPRVSAVAERLWSEKSHRNTDEATPRIEEHNCRMLFRGIDARPANSYGLC
ncbi:beta-hexosaminidase subunit beta-like isoform X2 [Lucilia sericata]|uniref:beta-hexosaminidase subunit beta-like isoform X2 n=1 Tax=Lucilia sericata TaxID=13632 RepID=UPI0018A8584A|nr:beta-hexosaminidase subunit beta-like isoform X2 [Lucilia sericata]